MCKEKVTPMASPITEIKQSRLSATLRSLAAAGGTTEHATWMRRQGNASRLIQFIDEQETPFDGNLYEMPVESQLLALLCASMEGRWDIAEEEYHRLNESAPPWPKGKSAYRSLRIRFGEGSEGVRQTFERHMERIKFIFGKEHFRCWDALRPREVLCHGKPIEALHLLNGDDTHKATVEWVLVDLGTHRKRESIEAVRGVKSLADELLVIAWMFPDMIHDMDYETLPGLFAAGYELHRLNGDFDLLREVPVIHFYEHNGLVDLGASSASYNDVRYSVPELLG